MPALSGRQTRTFPTISLPEPPPSVCRTSLTDQRYAEVNNIVVLSALNPVPDHFKFLETLGLTGANVRTATYHAAAYQSAMRTSIREPSNGERKTIVVPDRPLAEYLQERFPGSRLHRLDAGIIEDAKPRKPGRPRKHQSNRERMAEQRAKEKEKRLQTYYLESDVEQIALRLEPTMKFGGGLRAEMGIRLITNIRTQPLPVQGTLYRGKYSGLPSAYLPLLMSILSLILAGFPLTANSHQGRSAPYIPGHLRSRTTRDDQKQGTGEHRLSPPPLARLGGWRPAPRRTGRPVSQRPTGCGQHLSTTSPTSHGSGPSS